MRTSRKIQWTSRILLACGICLIASAAHATKYTYTTPMVFPHPDLGQGAVIRTTDLIGVITRLRITLHDVNIPEPAELEVYFHPLENPGTQIHLFTRFPGTLVTADHATITFDDFTARQMAIFNGHLPSGTFNRVVASNAFSNALSEYIGANPNMHWELFVYIRGQGSIGSWSLDIENAEPAGPPQTFTSPSGLITNDSDFNPATPYPATLEVSGLEGKVVSAAEITLTDFSSPRPEDHDMLVEGPDTRGAVFFSDLGANCIVAQTPEERLFGGFHHECAEPLPVQNLTMTFAHIISGLPPAYPFGPLQSDIYPARDIDLRIPGVGDEDDFRVPNARFNNAHDLRALNGAPANGQWSLFVRDDQARNFESSTIGSWSVTIWPGTPEPLVMAPVSDIVRDTPAGQCSVPVTFDSPFVKGSPTPTLTINPASGSLFPVGMTTVHLSAFNYVGTADGSFNVTVRDLERPILATPLPMVFSNDPNPLGTQVHFSLSVSDNCPGVTLTANPPSGSYFAVGTHQVTAFATDASGNVSDTVHFTLTIEDTTGPVITYQTTPAISPNWVNHDVSIVATATDVGGSGVMQLVCLGTAPSVIGIDSVSATVSREGLSLITCEAFDHANNSSVVQLPVIRIDKTPPQILVIQSPEANAHGWNNTNVAVHYEVLDTFSGILDADEHIDQLFTTEGARNLAFFARDRAGNCSVIGNISQVCTVLSAPVVRIDKTPPVITIDRTPVNEFHWNNTDVHIRVTGTDALSGILSGDNVEQHYSAEGRVPGQRFDFTDVAGNFASAITNSVQIDKTPPVFTTIQHLPAPNAAGWNRDPVSLALQATDGDGSGVNTGASFSQLINTEGMVTLPHPATDFAGNTSSHTFVVKTDWTPPVVTASRFGAPNADGWDSEPVSIRFEARDQGSGMAPGGGLGKIDFVSFGAEGENLTATSPGYADLAGNVAATVSLTGLNIDRTPPVVTKSRAPAANANGWNNTDVTVNFQATDALSGIDGSTNVNQVFTAETNQTASHTFADRAGNTAQGFEINVLIDKTPPTVSSFVFPGPNAAGWNNTPVTLRFDGHDGNLAGINSGVVGPAVVELPFADEGLNSGSSQTFTDRAGNRATIQHFGINIDRTPPQVIITKSPEANAFGWNSTDVRVQFVAADGLSGMTGNAIAEALVTGEVKNQQVSRQFFDVAGNRRDAIAAVSIDRTPPMLFCAANPLFITPGSGLVPVTLDVFFDDGDEFTNASRGPAYLRLQSIVSSAPQPGDIVDWTIGTDDRSGTLLAPPTTTPIVYTVIYEGSDLAGHVATCTMQVTVANPATQVFAVSPNSAVAGTSTDVALVIGGDGFLESAVVKWKGTTLSSTFVSANEIHATVPAALLASSGGVAVTVENPAPYAGAPGTGVFLVTDAAVSVTSMATGQSTPENPFVGLSAGATPEGGPDTVFVNAAGVGAIGLAVYSGNPGPAFAGGTSFFDVFVAPGSAFTNMSIWSCNLGDATEMFWDSPEGWRLASHQTYVPGDEFSPACIEVMVNAEGTSPTIGDLSGTYFAPGSDTTPPVLSVPADMSVPAPGPTGAVVNFAATAADDTATTIVCTPASGALFPIGETTVNCTATDAVGLVSSAAFRVTVSEIAPDHLDGRMIGDGFIAEGKAKHHFEFRVAARVNKERGQVSYHVTEPKKASKHERNDRFASTRITSVTFSDDPAFKPGRRRRAPTVDSVVVAGEGRWNGKIGYTFELRATDRGEPGRDRDTVTIVIKDAAGAVVASVSGELDGGNIQSSRLAGRH